MSKKKERRNEGRSAADRRFIRLHAYVLITRQAEDVPITWSRPHLKRISLVSAPSLDSSGSVVRHTNAAFVAEKPLPVLGSNISAVAFAGHSIAATSIFTPVRLISIVFMLGGGNVTRVPEREYHGREEERVRIKVMNEGLFATDRIVLSPIVIRMTRPVHTHHTKTLPLRLRPSPLTHTYHSTRDSSTSPAPKAAASSSSAYLQACPSSRSVPSYSTRSL